jgi:hypothetical protein
MQARHPNGGTRMGTRVGATSRIKSLNPLIIMGNRLNPAPVLTCRTPAATSQSGRDPPTPVSGLPELPGRSNERPRIHGPRSHRCRPGQVTSPTSHRERVGCGPIRKRGRRIPVPRNGSTTSGSDCIGGGSVRPRDARRCSIRAILGYCGVRCLIRGATSCASNRSELCQACGFSL